MKKIEINNSNHLLYKAFKKLYSTSFPIFEQRTEIQQEYAFRNDKYHLIGYCDEKGFIGFISYWDFDTYLYIEHFAISTEYRGKGYGSKLLNSFIKSAAKMVLLEIDPVIDDTSEARLRFYKRCGFHENPYPHKHAPYRNEFQSHSLVTLTTDRQIGEDEYMNFFSDLNMIVMNECI